MTQNPIVLRIQRLSDQWYEFEGRARAHAVLGARA